jgi:hypothetical protein
MNAHWWHWPKELRRRSVALGLAGMVLLAVTGLLTLLILDIIIL